MILFNCGLNYFTKIAATMVVKKPTPFFNSGLNYFTKIAATDHAGWQKTKNFGGARKNESKFRTIF